VNDKAAETFATTFYSALLNGATFGDAVTTARQETWENHPDTNTWGAYQCYGDPDFRLWAAEGGATSPQFATAQQVVNEIERVVAALASRAGEGVQDLVERLERIEKAAEPFGGTSNGAIAAALAHAYGEANEFDRAVKLYRSALQSESAVMRLKDLEQLANLESRWAAKAFKATDKADKREELRQINDASIRRLKWLAGAGERLDAEPQAAPGTTSERLALIAGAFKRKADMSSGDEKRRAEELSRKWYRTAAEVAQRNFAAAMRRGEGVRLNAYPLTAWAGAELMLAWQGRPLSRALRDELARLLHEAAQALRDSTVPAETVWDSVYPVDIGLLAALIADDMTDERIEDLMRRYAAIRNDASPREFDSVIGQIRRLMEAAGAKKPAPRGAAKAAAQLKKLVDGLEGAGS
jgi:hypothetical protein